MAFNISDNGVNFIKNEEGCVLTAYRLEGETYWTIGYGHYGADVYEGMTITEAQAEAFLRIDLERFVNGVNTIAVAKFPSMNQNQFDALCSYAFNRGLGATDGSNGLRQLVFNSSTLAELSTNIVVYWGSAEAYKDALIKRRKREQTLFNTPVDGENINDEIIADAIAWAVSIANDDSHGYDQDNRWGLDYDCSSLLIQAYEQAGCPVKTNGATYTGNMIDVFVATGFDKIPYTHEMVFIAGDVLWKTGHTEMYIGDGKRVGAHINEFGDVVGGASGDQTGNEISVENFSPRENWTFVLRLPSSFTPDVPDIPIPTNPKYLSKLLLYAVGSNII